MATAGTATRNVVIQRLTDSRLFDQVSDVILRCFCEPGGEPVNDILGITSSDFQHMIGASVSPMYQEGACFVAMDIGTGRVAGAVVGGDMVPLPGRSSEDPSVFDLGKLRDPMDLIEAVEGIYLPKRGLAPGNPTRRRGVVFHHWMFVVHPDYRGQRLLERLLVAQLGWAKTAGYLYSVAECTSRYSWASMQRLGAVEQARINYATWRNRDGVLSLAGIPPPHTACVCAEVDLVGWKAPVER
ncbi:hypothetical protein PAPYR_4448 [Paratrimastix pyriformis]|uniref:N-acetyltransferase domain-containing protein n=1 Tax=Paratrimastix pyriformis TaxID=342808 RepID=A0ABQ8UNU0_9EUKA|nr:hypothetical protein PAPYR_4448 [Paratrimastix pyriformis]